MLHATLKNSLSACISLIEGGNHAVRLCRGCLRGRGKDVYKETRLFPKKKCNLYIAPEYAGKYSIHQIEKPRIHNGKKHG